MKWNDSPWKREKVHRRGHITIGRRKKKCLPIKKEKQFFSLYFGAFGKFLLESDEKRCDFIKDVEIVYERKNNPNKEKKADICWCFSMWFCWLFSFSFIKNNQNKKWNFKFMLKMYNFTILPWTVIMFLYHNFFCSRFFFLLFLSIISHLLGKNQITFNINEIALRKKQSAASILKHIRLVFMSFALAFAPKCSPFV